MDKPQVAWKHKGAVSIQQHSVSGDSKLSPNLARAQVLFQPCSCSGVMTSMCPLEWLDGPQTPCTLHTHPREQWYTNPGCHNVGKLTLPEQAKHSRNTLLTFSRTLPTGFFTRKRPRFCRSGVLKEAHQTHATIMRKSLGRHRLGVCVCVCVCQH